eukprot:gene8686-9570_t
MEKLVYLKVAAVCLLSILCFSSLYLRYPDSSLSSFLLRSEQEDPPRRLQTSSLSPSQLHPDQLFLFHALLAVSNYSDLAFFSGRRVKSLFDEGNARPHVLLQHRMNLKSWRTVAERVNASFALQQADPSLLHYRAAHVHNEMNLGDVLHLIVEDFLRGRGLKYPHPEREVAISREEYHAVMNYHQPPAVFTTITNRTTKWMNMTNHLRLHYSSYETARHWLDSDRIVLVLANSHTDPGIGMHRKIISLPLGIKYRQQVWTKARHLLLLVWSKTRLLAINNSGWGPRTMINEMVAKQFNGTVQNTYAMHQRRGSKKRISLPLRGSEEVSLPVADDHMLEIAQSRFVLCPSGLGWDTYRLWEVLLLGSVPIIESNPGMNRAVASLPVLIVHSFEEVTPSFLEKAYPCFQEQVSQFNYSHLREDHWVGMVQEALRTASADHMLAPHPFRHRFCDFL